MIHETSHSFEYDELTIKHLKDCEDESGKSFITRNRNAIFGQAILLIARTIGIGFLFFPMVMTYKVFVICNILFWGFILF
jgi:hypothetical protein